MILFQLLWFYSSYHLFFWGGAKFLISIKERKNTQHRHSWQATCFNVAYLQSSSFFFFLEKMIRLKAIWTVWCLTQPMPMRKTLKWQTLKELWMTGQSGMWLAGTGEPRCTGRGGSQYVYMAWGAKKSLNLLTRQIHPENLFRRLNYFFRLRYIWATWTKRCVSEKEAVD